VAERKCRFPDGFVWGAATSAYQIEGAPLADGAGPSIWDRFAHEPGRIRDGRHADVACDHYHRWREDVDLMASLGLRSYRFSIAWSRVLPAGTGAVNPRGLDFYSRLVDALLERGITPNATLYHWDLPAALQDRGGWENPDSERWFADYARVVFEALDDRVPMWATLNEPAVVTDHGYVRGVDAPGVRDAARAPLVAHHLMLAHGAAVRVYREAGRHSIGLVVNLEPKEEASDVPEDRAAAVRADVYTNRLFLDAALLGRYPAAMKDIFGAAWPAFPDEELARIRQPLDWVGINYYTRRVVCHDDLGGPARASGVHRSDVPMTAMGWEIIPSGLTHALRMVKDRYGDIPLHVTENGAAFDDTVAADGAVHDPDRVAYLRSHLGAVADAIAQGVDVRGYYAWSLLDNFEWHSGFSKRFGLVRVDYDTLARTPKDSARFYAEVIRNGGAGL
jgi:beta-glucosidase